MCRKCYPILQINFEKTKVLTTQQDGGAVKEIRLQGKDVEVLGLSASEKYLGRKLCIEAPTSTELEHRIAAAWATFMQFKAELCNRHYPLQQRLRLFDALVTPRACFAAAAWTMTESLEKQLRGAQRRMLRLMVCRQKHIEQDWATYMQQSTHELLRIMAAHQLKDWVCVQRIRKWRFARATASRTDGRWSSRILTWKPKSHYGRSVGRPATRWCADLEHFLGENWVQLAIEDPKIFELIEPAFIVRDL